MNEYDLLAAQRAQSRRQVQIVFSLFTLFFAVLGFMAHRAPEFLSVRGLDHRRIADSFLVLSAGYLVALAVWERLYAPRP